MIPEVQLKEWEQGLCLRYLHEHESQQLIDAVRSLKQQLAAATARAEQAEREPRTIEEAEALVLRMAKKFRAYGAMIEQCRIAWAAMLKERYGIESGAFDTRMEQAMVKMTEERAAAIESAVEAEQNRWQDRLNWLHTEYGADGSGCDSGDPLDLINTEARGVVTRLADLLGDAKAIIQEAYDHCEQCREATSTYMRCARCQTINRFLRREDLRRVTKAPTPTRIPCDQEPTDCVFHCTDGCCLITALDCAPARMLKGLS